MENIVIDLRIKVANLEAENAALKYKIEQMYKDWKFDYNRFSELKQAYAKILQNNEPHTP